MLLHTIIPCKTFISQKASETNDKLQTTVAIRSGGVIANNQIEKGLLPNQSVNFFIDEYLAKLQAKTFMVVSCTFLRCVES